MLHPPLERGSRGAVPSAAVLAIVSPGYPHEYQAQGATDQALVRGSGRPEEAQEALDQRGQERQGERPPEQPMEHGLVVENEDEEAEEHGFLFSDFGGAKQASQNRTVACRSDGSALSCRLLATYEPLLRKAKYTPPQR